MNHSPLNYSLRSSIARLFSQKARYLFRKTENLILQGIRDASSILVQVNLRSIVYVCYCYFFYSKLAPGLTEIHLRGLDQPIRLRNQTSDFDVFREIIIRHQYDVLGRCKLNYAIDAGANIGLTSLYLLSRHPELRIVAIEPDPENYSVAKYNLAPFGERCQLVAAGVWNEDTTLTIQRGSFRDGRHWATQTVAAETSSSVTIPALPMLRIIEEYDVPHIDFLKMDIEGAELQVFLDGDTSFMSNTSCCAIECHGDACENAFRTVAEKFQFAVRQEGELLVATSSDSNPDQLP